MVEDKNEIKREVEKYMKLPYTIKLVQEDDGTYSVSVEELPGCLSAGATVEEAMEMIKDAMADWFTSCIERGIPIPLPNSMNKYSGKFLVRVPKSLHKRLVETAKKEGISLNQLVVYLLSERLAEEVKEKLEETEGIAKK